MATWGKAFGASALYFLCALGWGLLGTVIMILPMLIMYLGVYSGAYMGYTSYELIIYLEFACIFGGITLIFLGTESAHFKLFGEVAKDGEIDWGTAWRGAGKMYGWVLLWILAAVGIILLGIFLPINGPESNYVLIACIIAAGVLAFLGICAAYFKIFGEIISDYEKLWDRAWKSSAAYLGWCIIWILAGGGIIALGIIIEIYVPLERIPMMIISYGTLIAGIFLLIFGITAGFYKIFGEIVTESSIEWSKSFLGSIKYAGWAFLWGIAGGILIYIGFSPLIDQLYQPSFILDYMSLLYLMGMLSDTEFLLFSVLLQPSTVTLNDMIYGIVMYFIGTFITSMGTNAAYWKLFGDVIGK